MADDTTFRLRTTVVCVHDDKILAFNAADPKSGKKYVFLPGGAIEAGESLVESAIRETFEETGYKVLIDATSVVVKKYAFFWNGKSYDCETHFFRCELAEEFQEPQPVDDADYHLGVTWIPVNEAQKTFSYSPEIYEAVEELLVK